MATGTNQMSGQEVKRRKVVFIASSIAGAALGMLLLVLIWQGKRIALPSFMGCMLYNLFGVYCPTTGLTRATFALLGGDVAKTIDFNILAPLYYAVLGYLYVSWGRWAIWDKPFAPLLTKHKGLYVWLLLGLMLVFMVLRNIPVSAFDVLRP